MCSSHTQTIVKPPKDHMKDVDKRIARMKECVFPQTTKKNHMKNADTIIATKRGCVSPQATKRPFDSG